jgi:hypothetical protein
MKEGELVKQNICRSTITSTLEKARLPLSTPHCSQDNCFLSIAIGFVAQFLPPAGSGLMAA